MYITQQAINLLEFLLPEPLNVSALPSGRWKLAMITSPYCAWRPIAEQTQYIGERAPLHIPSFFLAVAIPYNCLDVIKHASTLQMYATQTLHSLLVNESIAPHTFYGPVLNVLQAIHATIYEPLNSQDWTMMIFRLHQRMSTDTLYQEDRTMPDQFAAYMANIFAACPYNCLNTENMDAGDSKHDQRMVDSTIIENQFSDILIDFAIQCQTDNIQTIAQDDDISSNQSHLSNELHLDLTDMPDYDSADLAQPPARKKSWAHSNIDLWSLGSVLDIHTSSQIDCLNSKRDGMNSSGSGARTVIDNSANIAALMCAIREKGSESSMCHTLSSTSPCPIAQDRNTCSARDAGARYYIKSNTVHLINNSLSYISEEDADHYDGTLVLSSNGYCNESVSAANERAIMEHDTHSIDSIYIDEDSDRQPVSALITFFNHH